MELLFRSLLGLIFGLAAAIGGRARLRAARASPGERFSRADEGPVLAVALRVAGAVLGASTLACLLAPRVVSWAAAPLPDWLRGIGGLGGLAGCGLMWWTLSNLGDNLTDTVAVRARASLTTTGPYAYVRHPFYVTAGVLMGSVSLLTANGLVAGSSAAVLGLLAARTPKEELRLIERFGDEYREYMRSTPRFVPRLRRREQPRA